jgi:hypothetical protein
MEKLDLETLVATAKYYIINNDADNIILNEFINTYKKEYGENLYSQEIFDKCKVYVEQKGMDIYQFYAILYYVTSDVNFLMALLKFAKLSTGEYINVIKILVVRYDILTVVKYSLQRFPHETELLKVYLSPTVLDIYKKYIDLLDEVKILQQENDDLKLQILHYKYMPSEGYLQAKENFEKLKNNM